MRTTRKYKSLPYNPALRVRAKELRNAGVLYEAHLMVRLMMARKGTINDAKSD